MVERDQLERWRKWSRQDDWHLLFVGSDIRQMLGEIERLEVVIASIAHSNAQNGEDAMTMRNIAMKETYPDRG